MGSAEDSTHDQTLEEVLVGPVPVGVNKFVLQAPSPNFDLIPQTDVLGVTVVLVTCSFMDHEFIRIGYYVNNEYADPLDPEQPLPNPLEVTKIYRNILADQPRVTRFPIDWSGQSYQEGNSEQNLNIPVLSAEEMPTAMENDEEIVMSQSGDEEDGDEEDGEDDEEVGDNDNGEVDIDGDESASEDEEDEEEEEESESVEDNTMGMEILNESYDSIVIVYSITM